MNVKRLFALSSPLQGARLAQSVPFVFTEMHRDMRPDSKLYHQLAAARRTAEVFCYTRLRDNIVGEIYAAPAGQTAWWLDSPTPLGEHWLGVLDRRALADITRRLRGEDGYATVPPAPLLLHTRPPPSGVNPSSAPPNPPASRISFFPEPSAPIWKVPKLLPSSPVDR